MPSYNQGCFIEEGITSVLGQNYPCLEFIVMDGGSTDQTLEILKKYAGKLTYWQSRKDNGQSDAIMQGVARSTGEVICWLNSDDMLMPGALLDVGKKFRPDQKYRLIYGASVYLAQEKPLLYCGSLIPLEYDPERLTYLDYLSQPSAFWTRALWDAVGGINVDYHYVMDWDFYNKAAKLTAFEYVPRFYSIFRKHPLHKSGLDTAARRKEIVAVAKAYATPYWGSLYEEVEKRYSAIQALVRFTDRLRLPRLVGLLPVLFPGLAPKVKKLRDLETVLGMFLL